MYLYEFEMLFIVMKRKSWSMVKMVILHWYCFCF